MNQATRSDRLNKNAEKSLKSIQAQITQTGQEVSEQLAASLIYLLTRDKPQLGRSATGRSIIKVCQARIKGTMADQVLYGPRETAEDKRLMRKWGVDT